MAFLRSFGRYLPSIVMGNAELAARLGCDPQWILDVCGIQERRYAGPETVADMAAAAAKDCLERAGERQQPGAVIVSSASSEQRFPGPAATIAQRLGLGDIPAIDVPLASAGSLFGLSLASQLTAVYGRVLVIAAEKMSSIAMREPLDKNIAILFGDGAGACLVTAEPGPAEIVDFCLHSDGSFSNDLCLDLDGPMRMNGYSVILQAARKIPRGIQEVLAKAGLLPSQIDTYLMHQANQNLIDRVAKGLCVPADKFFSNIRDCGNTSSASMLIAAAEWSMSAGFRKDTPVVFAAFGAGFHWGALLAVGR